MKTLKKIDKGFGVILDFIPVVLTVFLLVLLSINIFLRWVPIYNLKWYNEIVELAFAWLIFIGAASLWRKKEHTIVDMLPRKLSGKTSGKVLQFFIEVLSIAFVFLFLKYSIVLIQKVTAVSPILQIPRTYFYLSMPIAGVIMIVYSIRNFVEIFMKNKGEEDGD